MDKPINAETSATVRFDGVALHPLTPIDLVPNAIYEVTIKAKQTQETKGSLWQLLGELAGTVDAPSDWASEHDHYIHGTPKRKRDPET